jgi:hypothetical protein
VDSKVITQEVAVEYTPSVQEVRAAEVYCWRFDQLERAGYSSDLAHCLAEDNTIDLHLACELLERGCPQGTAVRILT